MTMPGTRSHYPLRAHLDLRHTACRTRAAGDARRGGRAARTRWPARMAGGDRCDHGQLAGAPDRGVHDVQRRADLDRQAPLKVPGYASFLSVAGLEHGWLLMASGGAMGQEPVQLYRTSDAGLRWSLVAETPQTGTGSNGLPVSCDKTGLVFATASAWLSGACFLLSDALLVSRDGGVTWASQVLPVAASSCEHQRVRGIWSAVRLRPGSWSSTARPGHRISWSARISG